MEGRLAPANKKLLRRFAGGKTDEQIAKEFGCRSDLIAAQRQMIMAKLEIRSEAQLTAATICQLAQAETKGGGWIEKIGTAGPPARDGAVATGDMIIVRYADDFVIGFEHHRPTASRRSVRTVPAGANVVAVGVVAAAAVGPGRSGSDRSGAHRGRTDTVAAIAAVAAIGPTPIAVAPATHCDGAASSPSNCDSAAAVASATAPIAATSATASIGVVGNEGD